MKLAYILRSNLCLLLNGCGYSARADYLDS